jgi:hypothetical protein
VGLKISLDDKKFAKDDVVAISGLAAVPNGGSVVVSDADLATWEEANGVKLKDALDGSAFKLAQAADPKVEEEAASAEAEGEEVK